MSDELTEYESQLSEINEMLEADPNDESLLQLKEDLLSLIDNTEKNLGESLGNSNPSNTATSDVKQGNVGDKDTVANTENKIESQSSNFPQPEASAISTSEDNHASGFVSSKKTKKNKIVVPTSFEPPTHLIPLESDTAAERSRKRRAIKTLKSKWRERVKESTTTKKQKSWQDFVSMKGKKSKSGKKRKALPGVAKTMTGGSIFKTEDGVNARVGVIGSGKSMTEFGERKRFKM